jgi:pimeloyl-ACP methyl ester carboxylesterase
VRYPAFVYTEHLRIPVGTGALHVERLGRGGPAVVLLHGFGSCSFLWRAIAPVLAGDGYTVVAVDLLGHGESDRPTDAPYSLGAQAEYVERALTAMRLGEVSVVGQDMGALVGLLLAAQHPSRVRRVALLEPLDPDDLPGPAIRSLQRNSALTALTAQSLFGARPLLATLLEGAVSSPDLLSDRLLARYLAPFVGSQGAAQLLQLASAVELSGDERHSLRDVQTDILLWCGVAGEDPTDDEGARRTARWTQLLPAAQVQTVAALHRAGTLVAEDAPEALVSALRPWIT